jgi:hypothetical protein
MKRPNSEPPKRLSTLSFHPALALPLALASALSALPAACATDEVHQDTLVARQGDSADSASLRFYFARSDVAPGATSPLYHVLVDGRLLVLSGSEEVGLYAGNSFCCAVLPAGRHTFELRDQGGATYVQTPLLETGAGLAHHLIVFGDPAAPEYRLYVDDPATVPAGMAHVRLLNALDSRQSLSPQRCPGNALGACAPVGADVDYGETFEIDSPRETLGELTWSLASAAGPPLVGSMATPLPPEYSSCISNYLRAVLFASPTEGTALFDSGLGSGTPLCGAATGLP